MSSYPASPVHIHRRHIPLGVAALMVVLAAGCLAAVTADVRAAVLGSAATLAALLTGYLTAQIRVRALLAEAYTDPLTGLPGRTVAEHLLTTATERGHPVTVALADVDNLNAINTVGHVEGDQYLIAVAERLCRVAGHRGTVVRLGGDEFALLTPAGPADLHLALTTTMTAAVLVAGTRIRPRVSVGIATTGGGNARHALARADLAMHTAKQIGGDRALIYDPDRDGVPDTQTPRPQVRHRDLPAPGLEAIDHDGLLRIYVTLPEARSVHQALITARARWEQLAEEASCGGRRPSSSSPPVPASSDRKDVTPTPSGFAVTARIARAEADRYARLAHRVQGVIDRASA